LKENPPKVMLTSDVHRTNMLLLLLVTAAGMVLPDALNNRVP